LALHGNEPVRFSKVHRCNFAERFFRGAGCLDTFEDFRQWSFEANSNLIHAGDREIAGAAFHVGNIGTVEFGFVSEFLLGNPAFKAQLFDGAA